MTNSELKLNLQLVEQFLNSGANVLADKLPATAVPGFRDAVDDIWCNLTTVRARLQLLIAEVDESV